MNWIADDGSMGKWREVDAAEFARLKALSNNSKTAFGDGIEYTDDHGRVWGFERSSPHKYYLSPLVTIDADL